MINTRKATRRTASRTTAARIAVTIAGLAVSGLLVGGLSACAAGGTATPTTLPTTASTSGVVAPIVVAVKDLPGANIPLKVGEFLDINVEESNAAAWTASVATPNVVEFLPGGPNGSAIDNPGFGAVGVGATDVKMSDGTTIVEFTITVTAG